MGGRLVAATSVLHSRVVTRLCVGGCPDQFSYLREV